MPLHASELRNDGPVFLYRNSNHMKRVKSLQ